VSAATEAVVRRALLVILLIGLAGTATELVLLKHFEEPWQVVPLALVSFALLLFVWYGVSRSALPLRALSVTMWACLAAGVIGVAQHFRTNVIDARESNPSLTRREAYREALSGSLPALAPGTMIQIGLIGLTFLFRHPRLRPPAGAPGSPSQPE
jgi:hypothetical protein